jgi:gluconolactonase
MKVDLNGNLYVADTSGIWIFSSKGRRLGKISIPEAPANCAWGDNDLRSLFITARTSLYRVRLKISGSNVSGRS